MYSLHGMASFAVSRFSERGATILAREWCAKMEFWFSIWMRQDRWDYTFSDADLASYVPHSDFVEYFVSLDDLSVQMDRASQLSSMAPGKPKPLGV